MLYWTRGLSSKGRTAATRSHNNDSTELEIKPAAQSQWLLIPLSQQAKKAVSVQVELLIRTTKGKLAYYSTMEARKSMSRMPEIP